MALNEAIIWSLRPTLWSSSILRIDPRSGYLSKVGIRVFLRLFSILGNILQSDWCLVSGILNYRSSLFKLSIFRVFLSLVFWLILKVILSMQCSENSIAKKCYLVSIIQHRSKIYTVGSAEDVYISAELRALPTVIHILIGMFTSMSSLCSFTSYRNYEDTIFIRWMECNTPFPEYVLSCVFKFFWS